MMSRAYRRQMNFGFTHHHEEEKNLRIMRSKQEIRGWMDNFDFIKDGDMMRRYRLNM